jgi:prepilin-type N-terminal cleavage/methylation domain-containing protein
MHPLPKYNSGFSLVELSIVLIILGLLTGGILGGRSLIRAAEVRSIGTDIEQYLTAIYTFQEKYNALPGDLRNATQFWGEQHADPATCRGTASTTELTCDGDGDGLICPGGGNTCWEMHRFWQHLANAGMITGTFTGVGLSVPYASTSGSYPGKNAPQMRLQQTTLQVRNQGTMAGDVDFYDGSYGHLFYIGKSSNPNESDPFEAFLDGGEAWGFDTKFDDGKPAKGHVRSFKKDTPKAWFSEVKDCATTDDEATAEYDVAKDSPSCSLIWKWK